MDKYCKYCDKTLPIEEFYTGRAKCKTCYNTARYKSLKEIERPKKRKWIFDYLMEHPCVDCGETNPVVLEFDHLIPKEKFDCISNMVRSYSLKKNTGRNK